MTAPRAKIFLPAAPRVPRLAQIARWTRRPFHRVFWRLLIATALMGVFTIILLRSTAENPRKNIAASSAALRALQQPPLSDADNAALDYKKAFAALPLTKTIITPPGEYPPEYVNSMPNESLEKPYMQDYLARNAGVYPNLESAATKAACDWKFDFVNDQYAHSPPTEMRHCARLLTFRMRLHAMHGEHKAAAEDLKVAMIIAKHAGQDPFWLDANIGNSIRSIALTALQWIMLFDAPTGEDDVQAYRAALVAIPDPYDETVRVLKGEAADYTYTLDRAASLPAANTSSQLFNPQKFGLKDSGFELIYGSERKTLLAVMDDAISCASKRQYVPNTPELFARNTKGPCVLVTQILPGLYRLQEAMLRDAELMRCANTALTVAVFRIKNKRDPNWLRELVPSLLREIPSDSYNQLPLRLLRSDNEVELTHLPKPPDFPNIPQGALRIYSFGRNGIDDHGKCKFGIERENGKSVNGDDPVFFLPPLKAK